MAFGIESGTVLEIRDRLNRISVLALCMRSHVRAQRAHLHDYGYFRDGSVCVVMKLSDQKATADAFKWDDRTMQTAHQWIESHYDELRDGDVVDVEFILGETKEPKKAEVTW